MLSGSLLISLAMGVSVKAWILVSLVSFYHFKTFWYEKYFEKSTWQIPGVSPVAGRLSVIFKNPNPSVNSFLPAVNECQKAVPIKSIKY